MLSLADKLTKLPITFAGCCCV